LTTLHTDPFCDYLSVTFSPDNSPYYSIVEYFESLGFLVDSRDVKCTYIAHVLEDSRLTVRLETSPQFHKLSIGGYTLDFLRVRSYINDVLALCASVPHRVTRLDAAVDVRKDAVAVFRSLDRKYPDGAIKLSRKSAKVTKILSRRPDGLDSGTYYIGKRTAKVYARVYDKSHEAMQKRGEEIPFHLTRYELSICDGVTLRDVSEPAGAFWFYASPSLLKAPVSAPAWEKREIDGWTYSKPDKLPAEVLEGYLERSCHLERMVEIADSIGPNGRRHLLSKLTRILDQHPLA